MIYFLAIGASSYTEVYVNYEKTVNFFYVPTFLALNIAMIYAVIKMRFVIKASPEVFPNENKIVVHVIIFTVVTTLWVLWRVYFWKMFTAYDIYKDEMTYLNYHNYLVAKNSMLRVQFVYILSDNLLCLFMLYQLHSFSIFRTTVYDPIT